MPGRGFANRFSKITQFIVNERHLRLNGLRREARRAPDDVSRLEALCAALQHRGRTEEATQLGRDFLARSGDAHLEPLGDLFRRLGALDLAEQCYLRLHELAPRRAAASCKLGLVYAQRGENERARCELEHAVELEPQDPRVWYRLGTFHLQRRELEQAEKHLRHALEVDPEYAPAHANLGFLLDLRGERPAAQRSFRRALQLAPRDAGNHFNLGALYAEARRFELAIEAFQAGLELQPASVEGHHNLGGVYLDQGRHDEAMARFQRVLQLRPGHLEALHSLGLCYLRKGMYERALQHFEEAARGPGGAAPRLLYAMGLCYNGLELPRQGVRVLSQLVEQMPDHARAHHILGVCYDKLGDRERASRAYRCADLCVELSRPARGGARLVRDD